MMQDGKPEPLAPRSRILYSLLLILLMVGVIPLALNSIHLILQNIGEQVSYVLELQNEMLSNVAELTSSYLRNYRTKLEDMAQSYAMTLSFLSQGNLFDTSLNSRMLTERIKSDSNIIKLGSSSVQPGSEEGDGRFVARQDIKDATLESYIREGTKVAGAGEFYMSPPYYYAGMRDTLIVMATPVKVPSDEGSSEHAPTEVQGVVFAVINLNQLQDKLSENIKRGLDVFVLDGNNALVAHTDPRKIESGEDFSDHPLVREFDKYKRVVSVTPPAYPLADGGTVSEYIGTGMPVPGEFGWAVFGQANKDKAYKAVRIQVRNSVLTVLAVLAIVVFVGLIFGVSISRPIQQLAEQSLRLARGDYTHKIEFKANNELGQLAATFNYMSDEIQERESRLMRAAEENEQLFLGTIQTLAAAIDAKDPYTRGHSERVTHYTVAIAEEMGMGEGQVQHMRISALLHDVGKIGIDDSILRKPGALTDEEYDIMKGHPQKGAEIMFPIKQMRKFIPGIRFHHETLAGTGYPLGLSGDQIPVEALIIQVADTFDAMTTDRPYQKAMEVKAAVDRIQSFVGKRYDQRVVDALKQAVASGKIIPGTTKRRTVEV